MGSFFWWADLVRLGLGAEQATQALPLPSPLPLPLPLPSPLYREGTSVPPTGQEGSPAQLLLLPSVPFT